MVWVVGVDEAGYGPNLGPFVMSAVACRVPDSCADGDLWHSLQPAVRRAAGPADDRLVIDDSKAVYSAARGLAALERGVLAVLHQGVASLALADFLNALGVGDSTADLRGEAWYRGAGGVPLHAEAVDLAAAAVRVAAAAATAGVAGWLARSVVVCPARFNTLIDAAGSKGVVLGHALCELLRAIRALTPSGEPLVFFIDKHGGRNAYSALIQHALPDGIVAPGREGMAASEYRVLGLGRDVRLTFRPRMDAEHFCVALASMTSKYLRERLMEEFNCFWQERTPGLKATAGYPGDARRFFDAIRPAAERLGIAEERLWRKR